MKSILYKNSFFLILIIIAFLGLFLRLIKYDRIPPFTETQDEFFYPWSGMTMIKTGMPVGWSWFESYPHRNIVVYWGAVYPLVSPWVEKPPLYPIITGFVSIISGASKLSDVRLSTIRLVPVILSFFTIMLIGFFAKYIFDEQTALISALLYATVPAIVMANRLSLVENLLTPISLLTLILLSGSLHKKYTDILIPLLCGLAVLTKDIGIALPVSVAFIYFFRKKFKEAITLGIVSLVFLAVHPLMGFVYGWELFKSVANDYRQTHAVVGLPELAQTIFNSPTIASKERLFQDGSMLAGYIMLFAAPFWLKAKELLEKEKYYILLSFPFVYLLFLGLLESGGTQFSFFGWHVFPLFPFLMILLARAFSVSHKSIDVFILSFFFLIIGFSSVRFLLLVYPDFKQSWQYILSTIFIVFFLTSFTNQNLRKYIFLAFFAIYILINIFTVINLGKIYTEYAQPLF